VSWLVILHNESDGVVMNFFRVLSQLGLLCSLLMLGACGNGGGADNTTDPTTPTPPTTTATILSGAYQGTATASSGVKEFVSAITPAGKFYAMYFWSSIPDIYEGSVTLGVNGNATVSALRAFQNGANAGPYTATVTGASSTSYAISPVGFSVRTPSSVSAAALSTTSDLSASAWTGTWSDSSLVGALANQSLAFDGTGVLNNFNFYSSCRSASTSLSVQPISGASLYNVTLNIPQITGCDRTETSAVVMTGVAFVYPLTTVPGKTQRLDMVMVDSTGSGITFRGER
jgi:hypothetical protein